MRRIKFRAWDNISKRMKNNIEKSNIFSQRYLKGKYMFVMQFTGLKDKNGKEIYEGDIVRILKSNVSKETINGKVVFESGSFIIRFVDADISVDYKECEVIGNIYENKKLLEEKE